MTYGMLRDRILSLLDIGTEELASEGSLLSAADGLLPQTVDATARKAALLLKCIVKTAVLHFEYGESDAVAVRFYLREAASLRPENLWKRELRGGGREALVFCRRSGNI